MLRSSLNLVKYPIWSELIKYPNKVHQLLIEGLLSSQQEMKTFHFEDSKVYGKLHQQKAKVNFIYLWN
jgi:hypothetical protein